MLMIVFWHSTNHGGLEKVSSGFDDFNLGVQFIKSLTCVSVDVYVLISGYFLCTQKFRLSRLVKIWIQVFFYAVIILSTVAVLNIRPISITDVLHSLLPVTYRVNWFVSTYIGLCLLSPILNQLINSLTQRQHFASVLLLLLLTSVWHDLMPMSFSLDIYDGKRLAWFIVIYMVAAYIRKYMSINTINTFKMFCMYLLSCIIHFLVWCCINVIGDVTSIESGLIDYASNYYFSYGSTFTFISAILLFLTFLGLRIDSNAKVAPFIVTIASLTFGVYLIHDNYLLYEIIWGNMLMHNQESLELIVYSVSFCVVLFTVCLLIDYARSLLFKPLYKSKSWARFSAWVDTIPNKVIDCFTNNKIY